MARGICLCKWCNKKTLNTGTKECDSCWELRSRVERNPVLAAKMILKLGLMEVTDDN